MKRLIFGLIILLFCNGFTYAGESTYNQKAKQIVEIAEHLNVYEHQSWKSQISIAYSQIEQNRLLKEQNELLKQLIEILKNNK